MLPGSGIPGAAVSPLDAGDEAPSAAPAGAEAAEGASLSNEAQPSAPPPTAPAPAVDVPHGLEPAKEAAHLPVLTDHPVPNSTQMNFVVITVAFYEFEKLDWRKKQRLKAGIKNYKQYAKYHGYRRLKQRATLCAHDRRRA